MSTADAAEPALRADAARNRERIVAAARELFAERGINAPLEDVAQRAGVGIATLYRRFPTRADLIAGAFEAKLADYADAVTTALADPDPWRGFCGYLETVCAMQAIDRGFAELLTLTFPAAKVLEAKRVEAYDGFAELITRAKAGGRLREDFVSEDLVLLLMANAGVIAATGDAAPDAWRRTLAYFIQSFAAENTAPLPEPPTKASLFRAMVRLNRGT
ncbi:TetR/AcrR family transcriptional regulator [Cryptosporangium aurantiacum]|nr:TetR/AcrR family transcriptional regulator [Cryptosporangium aurantiacum]